MSKRLLRKRQREEEDDDEEEIEVVDSSEKLSTCLIDKKKEYETLKSERLDLAYITSILDGTINNNEIQNCGNLNMWINFRSVFDYELKKVDVSSPEREKQALMNMLFKLDSIHDFFGERTPYKKDELKDFKEAVLNLLGWNNKEIIETVNVIIKGHFENDLFMWLIFDGLRYIIKNVEDSVKYNRKIMLTESIQNYISRVSQDKDKSTFTIDAGLVDFITFRDFLKNISKSYKTDEIDIGDAIKILQYYKHVENIDSNKFEGVNEDIVKDAKICILNILTLALNDKDIYENVSPSVKESFFKIIFNNEKAPFTKSGCEKKYTHRFIGNIAKSSKNIKPIGDILNPDMFKTEPILKIFISHSKEYFENLIANKNATKIKNEIISLSKCSGIINKTELKEPNIIKNTFEKLDNDSEEFKIISPQKFDSNRTTGGSWTKDSIDKILYLKECNDNNEEKIIKSSCSFQVLKDICYFYSYKEGENKRFVFEISNNNYPIQKIIVVKDILGYEKGEDDVFRKEIGNNLYDETQKTLYCKNAPGVTELLSIYDEFKSPKEIKTGKGKKQKTEKVQLYEPQDVLNNILTIKRAGDYSQIWFCKQWNKKESPKLFFMSNDRMSASFCLLEQVPFVCLIRNYGVYFNPFLPEPIEGSTSYTQYSIKDKIKLIQNKNVQITDSFSNCLGNKNVLEDYLSFINENKNIFINNDKDITSILNYLDRIIFNQSNNNYLDDTIDEEKISFPIIQGEISGKKPLVSIYKYIENIAEKESQTLCTDILKNSIIKKFKLDLEMTTEITPQDDDMIDEDEDEDIGKELYLSGEHDLKKVNALINTDNEPYQTVLQQELNKFSANIKCKNIVSIINICVRLYNEFIKNIYTDDNDKYTDKIDQASINYYKSNYDVLLDCLIPMYNQTRNSIVKKAIRYVLPDEFEEDISMITPSSFAFSFENGLTYYKTYPSIPKKINTSKYKHANNVYVMDRKGYLKIEGSNLKGDIQLTNRNPKSVSYTDGTKISYYSF